MSFLSKLFGRSPTLGELARGPDRGRFASELSRAGLIVPAAVDHPGLPADEATKEEFLAMVEEHASSLAESDSWVPFSFEREGITATPVFTTDSRVEQLLGEYSKARNRMFPFMTYNVSGCQLATLFSGCESLVLDPGQDDEYTLTSHDRENLATLCDDE